MKRKVLAAVFLPGFFTLLSSAQVDISPGVARISLIEGEVSSQRGDTGDWSAAALNQPLVGGDRISTGDGSKAELQLDHANVLRLGNNAQAKIATLERAQIQVQVGRGIAYYNVFKDSEGDIEIDTPNAAIRPTSKEGVYRIEVNGFETQVIVRAGAVEISTPQGNSRVETGQAATVRGTTEYAGNVLGGAPSMDSWDSWNDERDGVIRNAQSWNYTNRYYVGSEDLDAHGHWVNVEDYGRVWSPIVGGGWSPYRAGRWVWEPYWGWTWVSKEPWGWTPYHYGRWVLYGKSWVWWPGPVDGDSHYRPEWAPAYVTFFGFGGKRGVAAGFGSVGWLASGPGDYFYRWYGRNGSHFNVVNVADATDILYINRGTGVVAPLLGGSHFSSVGLAAIDARVRKAISTLGADRFGTGRSAPKSVSGQAFRDGRIITGTLPIIPTREMLSATNRAASASSMIRAGEQRRFFTKRQPAAAPQSLDEQVAQVQKGIEGDGQVVPVREVTQLDSSEAAQPSPLDNGVERTVEPTKDVPSEHRSVSPSGRDLRVTASARIPRSNLRSTRRMMTVGPMSRGATARVASKVGGGSRTAAFSRVPTSTSTRRMALAPGSRGVTARAAQSYMDSANRQMDKGNYMAAIANYKRASQVDGNSAARARLDRARRAMQAEKEIIANRR